jgi:hypothetical protein
MIRYQVNYQRRDVDGQTVKGSVIHRARHQGLAIDWTAEGLRNDDDTVSFVILAVKQV